MNTGRKRALAEYGYSLVTRKEEPAFPDLKWRESALGRELCSKCGKILGPWHPRPIDIRLEEWPTKSPIDHVTSTGISLIRTDLLSELSPFMKDFAIGACYDTNGKPIDNYHTYYMPPWVVERGEKYADFRICRACGAIWLNTRHQRRIVLLRRDFAQHSVRQGCVGETYVSETVRSALVKRWSRKIEFYRIPLVDVPPDGERLPGDPDWAALQRKASRPE